MPPDSHLRLRVEYDLYSSLHGLHWFRPAYRRGRVSRSQVTEIALCQLNGPVRVDIAHDRHYSIVGSVIALVVLLHPASVELPDI